MDRPLIQITECFYVDGKDRIYFCVGDFIRHHRLRDSPELQRFIAADMKALMPGLLILEEQN